MKRIAFAALALGIGFVTPAVAEFDYVDCRSNLQRPIAVPSSTGHVTYLSVNTLTSTCAVNWQDDPLFNSSTGGDSGGTSGGDTSGGNGGSGCGGDGGSSGGDGK